MDKEITYTKEKYMWEDYIVCPNCKYEGTGLMIKPGSIFIEIILWLFMIIPGLIYSIWRLTSRKNICPKCKYPYVKEEKRKVPYVWSVAIGGVLGRIFRTLFIAGLFFGIFYLLYRCSMIFA